MARSKIEWLARPNTIPESWNVVTGCSKISLGCANCYAERMARRLAGRFGYPPNAAECPVCHTFYDPAHPFCDEHPNKKLIRHHPFNVTLHPERLDQPLHWKKPRTVFVCSMSDLFHEDVPFAFITEVFARMVDTPHTFLILTKRPRRMLAYHEAWRAMQGRPVRPLPDVWLGVTVENPDYLWRIGELLKCPAAARFVSLEPMLGWIDLEKYLNHPIIGWQTEIGPDDSPVYDLSAPYLDWVIAGGESGPGARPMHPDWARDVRNQCQAAGVPFFFKQHGAWKQQETYPGDSWNQVTWMDSTGEKKGLGEADTFWRVGKKAAGRLLDGREWNEWPA